MVRREKFERPATQYRRIEYKRGDRIGLQNRVRTEPRSLEALRAEGREVLANDRTANRDTLIVNKLGYVYRYPANAEIPEGAIKIVDPFFYFGEDMNILTIFLTLRTWDKHYERR